jgi:predicted secreted Zn-dependent protease
MTDTLAIAAISALTALFIFAEGFHIAEAIRIRKVRKRYLEMIESMEAEQSTQKGGDFDRRAFRKTLGGWEQ